MGKGILIIEDESAAFGEEFYRRNLPYRQFHLVLSHSSAERFVAALEIAAARSRSTTIRIECAADLKESTKERWGRTSRFRWYQSCDFVVLPFDPIETVDIQESKYSILINVSAEHLAVLTNICQLLINGGSDISFALDNTVRIWPWLPGEGP